MKLLNLHKNRRLLFIALGSLLILSGNVISFVVPAADFWKGFIHGLSVVANLTGLVVLLVAFRERKRGEKANDE